MLLYTNQNVRYLLIRVAAPSLCHFPQIVLLTAPPWYFWVIPGLVGFWDSLGVLPMRTERDREKDEMNESRKSYIFEQREKDERQMNKQRAYVAVTRPDGFGIGIAVRGQGGFYATDWPIVETYTFAAEWAQYGNKKLGLTVEEASEIVASTMTRFVDQISREVTA